MKRGDARRLGDEQDSERSTWNYCDTLPPDFGCGCVFCQLEVRLVNEANRLARSTNCTMTASRAGPPIQVYESGHS